MFVDMQNSKVGSKIMKLGRTTYLTALALAGLNALGFSTPAFASDAPVWKIKEGNIPVRVTLKNITHTEGPVYVSIQTKEHYQSMKGFGGIIQEATLGEMTATFKVDEPGHYAVSVWHDLDDDGRFSMTDTYQILDGWGASGTPPTNGAPTFDDVKIKVESFGADAEVEMRYPN